MCFQCFCCQISTRISQRWLQESPALWAVNANQSVNVQLQHTVITHFFSATIHRSIWPNIFCPKMSMFFSVLATQVYTPYCLIALKKPFPRTMWSGIPPFRRVNIQCPACGYPPWLLPFLRSSTHIQEVTNSIQEYRWNYPLHYSSVCYLRQSM